MSQINLFFNAIRENPDDDIPRMALAKHLEERGDLRGELIRVQRILLRMAADDSERPVLERSVRELLRRGEVTWLAELPAPERRSFGFPSWRWEMRDGRLAVTMSADLFLDKDVQALAGSESWDWVESLELREVTPEQMEKIASSPLLAGVLSLTIGAVVANHTPVGDAVALAIAQSPAVANLRELALPHNNISPKGAQALADSRYLLQLCSLDLSLNGLGTRGTKALAQSSALPKLARLELAANAVGLEAVQALTRSPAMAGLTYLGLYRNEIDDRSVFLLADSPSITSLTDLNLRANRVLQKGCCALAESPNFSNLRRLNLGECKNHVGTRGARALARSRYITHLQMLEIGENGIGNQGVAALASSANFADLRELYLWESNIGDHGVAALTTSPHLTRLMLVDLRGNDIKGRCLKAFAASPNLNRITQLFVDGVGIGRKAKAVLEQRYGKGLVLW